MKTDKIEKKILEEISSGKYRNYYLIYNRKSTDEPNNQKNSITYQKAENGKFAKKERLNIAPLTLKSFCADGVISEKHSGYKENDDITISEDGLVQYRIERQKFQQLVQFLSMGLFKGIVCLCWDRVSRNKGDDTLVRKLMRKGIDFRFVYANYDKTSSGALHMDIDGMFAEHHSRVTSEKVKTATWNLRERGVCTFKAPIGYLNEGNMEHKPFDPVRAPIIKRMFEMYATGDWSLVDLARWANEEGLTTVPMRRKRTEEEMLAEEDDEIKIEPTMRPIMANSVQRIIVNKFYIGKLPDSNGEYSITSVSHEPLVDEELFYKANLMLEKKKTSMYHTDKIEHYFRGLVRCEYCKRLYTPYKQKGITYFGAHCIDGCINQKKNFNISFLEKNIDNLISRLKLTDDELIEIDARTKTDIAIFEEKRNKQIESCDRREKRIREDLTYLRTNKLTLLKTGVYSPDDFLVEENKLNNELMGIQEEKQVSDISMHEVIKDIVKLSELLKDTGVYYSFVDSREKEEITRVIFSELFVSENTFNFKCKNGFQALESRFNAVCGQGET